MEISYKKVGDPKVSIVVPVFGAEKTLEKCIKSIKDQTLANFEVILVDDGSKDSSGLICDQIAREDCRFRVIHKTNGGVASARQAGLDAVTGQYIIHVDPDDWIEPDMLESLLDKALSTGADMVICDYFQNIGDRQLMMVQRPTDTSARGVLLDLFRTLHGSCWNKLIRTEFCRRAEFVEGLNLSEDLLFICKVLLHNPKVAYLNRAFYHYVYQSGPSESKSFTADTFSQLIKVYDNLDRLFDDDELKKTMQLRFIPYIAYVGLNACDLSQRQYRNFLKRKVYILARSRFYSLGRKTLVLSAVLINKKFTYNLLSFFRNDR